MHDSSTTSILPDVSLTSANHIQVDVAYTYDRLLSCPPALFVNIASIVSVVLFVRNVRNVPDVLNDLYPARLPAL